MLITTKLSLIFDILFNRTPNGIIIVLTPTQTTWTLVNVLYFSGLQIVGFSFHRTGTILMQHYFS